MPKTGADKGGEPQTKPMPLGELSDYVKWVAEQKPPTPKSRGKQPTEPKKLAEPLEHGTKEPEK
ncbi:MAG: hypothetical protein ACXVRZ_15410 [Gaiellaceae bacterium]